MSNYNADSIEMEVGSDIHRRNPSRFLGSDDQIGIKNQLFEIIDNSVDEMIRYARENAMKDYAKLYIEIKEDDTVIVEDFGGGIPCEMNKKHNKPAIIMICESDSSGGKGRGTVGYDASDPSGINGAGMSVSKSCASFFKLEVASGSAKGRYKLEYVKGKRTEEGLVRIGDLEMGPDGTPKTGTKITYHYDPDVFKYQYYMGRQRDEVYSDSEIKDRLRSIILGTQNDNLEILYKFKNNELISFSNKNIKISDLINPNRSVHLELMANPEIFKADLYFEYDRNLNDLAATTIINRMKMRTSTSDSAIVDILWTVIRKMYGKDERKSTSLKGADLKKDYFRRSLRMIYIMILPNARYSAQTKNDMISNEYVNYMQSQVLNNLQNNKEFYEKVYMPYTRYLEEELEWKIKRQKEEKKRREAEERKLAKSKGEKNMQEIRNNPYKFEINKDNSYITIKESPRPISESTLVYVEGKSAGSDFNNLHKEKEYPIAIAIAEGKVPNLMKPGQMENKMTLDNRLYCLEAGYKDIAIFTDADADGNHIKLLHLYQIYTFARHYLDNRKVFIIPAPYSEVYVPEYTSINLYGEKRYYKPGNNFLFTSKEHQALVDAGSKPLKKFRGLADSSMSLKDLLTNRDNWIRVKQITDQDIRDLERLLTPGDEFKSNYMIKVYTDRLYFSYTINKVKNDINLPREHIIDAHRREKIRDIPEDIDYTSLLTKTGIYDADTIKQNIEETFKRTHKFE